MPGTPNYALPYPAITDPPNGPAQMQALANATDTALLGKSIRVVSSTSDVAVPYVGMIVFSTTDNTLYRWTGTKWVLLNTGIQWARFARTGSATQAVAQSTDTMVRYPTTVRPNPYVTPQASPNENLWTIAADTGIWAVTAGIRASATGGLWELSIAVGASTWSSANVKKATSFPDQNGAVTAYVDTAGAAQLVTVNAWHGALGTLNIVSFGEASSIDFMRIG